MYIEKDQQLVTRLLEATRAGTMDWAPSGQTNAFVSAMSGKYIVTVKSSSNSNVPDYVTIDTQDGTTVHRLSGGDYNEIFEIYQLARRRALRIDEAIDDILKELDSPE